MQNESSRQAKDFCQMFCVPFDIFDGLVKLALAKEWYDPTQVDATGQFCSNLELLILGGALHLLGKNSDHHKVSKMTNISKETHRSFFHKWCGWMSSVKDDYIFMPVDNKELKPIEEGYARYGLVGCVGSVDCVHVGWDACPAGDRNAFCGKEKYPSIVYEVICSNDRRILSVTMGFPRTCGDKTIVKNDHAVRSIRAFKIGCNPHQDGTSWLSKEPWSVRTLEGNTKTFHGKYLICDGGYLHWPCLMCGIADASHPGLVELSKVIATVRKDIECVFGSMKKRFEWLKGWSTVLKQQSMDNAFVTCCMLHNLLLSHDGLVHVEGAALAPSTLALAAVADRNTGCEPDNMWVRGEAFAPDENDADDNGDKNDDASPEEEQNWLTRLEALGNHILATQDSRRAMQH